LGRSLAALGERQAAGSYWQQVTAALRSNRTLDPVRSHAVLRLVVAYIVYDRASAAVMRGGSPVDGHAWAVQAAGALASLIEGKTVHCLQVGEGTVCDRRSNPTSRDRMVGQCFIGALDIAEEMAKSGMVCDWPKFSGGHYKISNKMCSPGNRAFDRSLERRSAQGVDPDPVVDLFEASRT